ncbi:MAG: CotS family spore coat protein [Eubacterium sp.]
MNEKSIAVLDNYDFDVTRTSRARGAILCDTNKGPMLLKECSETLGRIVFEESILNYIAEFSLEADCIVRNKENELISNDIDGNKYIVKKWFIGRECDVSKKEDISKGAAQLARLHNVICKVPFGREGLHKDLTDVNLVEVYEKHNRELKRIRTFMRNIGRKTEFELNVLNCYEKFHDRAVDATNRLRESNYDKMLQDSVNDYDIVHGNYNYHNIVLGEHGIAVTNFDRACINIQITDLYTYLRKVMEKRDWDITIGDKIINEYSAIRPISKEEFDVLYIMLLYPEKFWKIVNNYFNTNKAWVSSRNMEKLNLICCQNERKEEFLQKIF